MSTANAALVKLKLELPNTAEVRGNFDYTFTLGGVRTYKRVTGPFTIKVTSSPTAVTEFTVNHLTIDQQRDGGNATIGDFEQDSTNVNLWTATVTPTSAGGFRVLLSITGILAGTGNTVGLDGLGLLLIHYDVPPTFSAATRAIPVEENTATTENIATLDATEPNQADTTSHTYEHTDTISYSVTGGVDKAKFTIADTNKLRFSSFVPDFENPADLVSATPVNAASNNQYIVVVTATSGMDPPQPATQTLTVTVTDETEVPAKPAAPTMTAPPVRPTELDVSWTAPTNTGKPAISDYDVQYRQGNTGTFTDAGYDGTGTSTTLTGLTPGTSYEVQVRATNADGIGPWSDSGTKLTAANAAPAFSSATTAFSVVENTTAVTTATATDADSGDTVRYTRSGADSAKFDIGESTGAVTFRSAPDYENPTDVQSTMPANAAGNNVYIVTVTATSGTNARELSVSKTLIVTVTDETTEVPAKPAAPSVTADNATPTELSVSWTAPTNTGRPAISDYDVQYRVDSTGNFTDAGYTGTGTSTTLTGLTQGTAYQVQVRATNADGNGPWSASGTATTAASVAPTFSSSTTAFNVAENDTTVTTATATDADSGDTVRYTRSGADSAKFSIGASTGAVTFAAAPDYENPTDMQSTMPANAAGNNVYIVTVTATSGTNARELSVSKTLIVTVTDVMEPPGKPATPIVTGLTPTSVTMSWTPPSNTGPAISDYDVQYRQGSTGTWSDGSHTGTGTTATLTGLTQNASYEIQVRATNAEGTSPWSDAVTAVPQDNTVPVFSSDAAVSVAENTPVSTAVVTAVAMDIDPADEITGYTLSGTDSGVFRLDASSGALTFRVSPDFEVPTDVAHTAPAPADDAGNNTYVVIITATSGIGGRQLSTTQRLTVTVTNVDEMGIGLAIGTSVSVIDERHVTSEPSWTVTFDFSEPLVTEGDAAFAVADISVAGAGSATFGELTLTDAARAVYSVPVTVTTEGGYTFQVKSGSVGTARGDTYGSAGAPLEVIYNTPPMITDFALVPPPAEGYTVGSELVLELTFDDDAVDIPAGVAPANRPYIVLYLGEQTDANRRYAYWKAARAANSTIVTFAYEVQPGDIADVIHWEPRLVVPETTPITNGVSKIVTTGPADTGRPGGDAPGGDGPGVVAFPGETAEPSPGTVPQPPVAPLSQEAPVVGSLLPILLPTEETVAPVEPTQILRTPLIFNEIGNGAAGANDWLELRNVTADAVPLKNWGISIVVDGEKVDKPLVVFPSDASFSVPPNGILLLTQRPPDKTRLAGGIDITNPDTYGAVHRYLVAPDVTLPDDGQFLLLLRHAKGKLGTGEDISDVAGGGGSNTDAFIADKGNAFQTDIWPLKATVHPRENTAPALVGGKVWQREKADIVGYHKDAWSQAQYTGVGYKRRTEMSPATAGTPGYPNDAVKAVAAPGSVTFSEIMVDSAGGTLPQWIEVYNASKTAAVNLNRWKLEIQNVDSEELVGRPIVTLTLQEKVIQPNQTLLIVAGDARAASADVFPATRVYNLLQLHQKNLRIKRAQDTFLSAEGFTLKLLDRTGKLVDTVGNTDGNRRTNDTPAWTLPRSPVEEARSSLIRRYEKGAAEDGKVREGWVLAANINRFSADVYYGHKDDTGTPGYREGGALPVELAHFHIARTEAGVVIKWATASEVNNAGFILWRSDTGNQSAFRRITPQLLSGAGTTGERHDYAFTDKTAAPGIAYVYRLEEVSLAGHRETLATQRVKAGFTPAHRQWTTFGEVKRRK